MAQASEEQGSQALTRGDEDLPALLRAGRHTIADELNHQQLNALSRWAKTFKRTHAEASTQALIADWRHFARYCALLNQVPAAANITTICAYLDSMQGLAIGTIRRRATAVVRLFNGIERPGTNDLQAAIKEELEAITRAKADRGENLPQQAKPLRWQVIEKSLTAIDTSDIIHVRNRAMVRLAYDGLLRRSELVAAKVGRLRSCDGTPLGQDDATLLIPKSKTDQTGKGANVFCRQETACMVAEWIAKAQLQPEDRLFRSFQGRNRSINRDQAMHPGTVNTVFRWIAEKAGEDPEGVTGHSCRIGAAQDMIEAGMTSAEVAVAGRWSSEEMVIRYAHAMTLKTGAMARLAQGQSTARNTAEGFRA